MGEVELDGPTAARLEVDEQRTVLRVQHVACMRLTVEQLLHLADGHCLCLLSEETRSTAAS